MITFLTISIYFFRLEDTLIELYLSGYSKPVVTDSDHVMMPLETDDALPAEG